MARGAVLGSVLLVAAAAGAWWLFGRDAGPSVVVEDASDSEATHAKDADAAGMLATQSGKTKAPSAIAPTVAARILGRVVDAAGKGVEGVRVLVKRGNLGGSQEPLDSAEQAKAAAERIRKQFAQFDAPVAGDATPDFEATSDAEGRFTVAVDAIGSYGLDARPAAPAVGERSWVSVTIENLEPRTVLHVFVGRPLRGRVVDMADRPLAAVVTASWWKAAQSVTLPGVATDPTTGDFGWPGVPDGTLSMTVKVAGRVELNVRVTTPKTDVVIVRVGGGGTLRGWVVDGLGAPLPEADVLVTVSRLTARGEMRGDGTTGGSGRTKAGSDGAYRIEGLPAGRLSSVTLSAPGLRPRTTSSGQGSGFVKWAGTEIKEGAETTLDLVLSRGGTVSGRVLEAGSGKPVDDARVLLLASSDRWSSSESVRASVDAGGRFRFEDVPLGRYVVVASASRHYFGPAGRDSSNEPYDPSGPGAPDAPVVVLTKEGETVERDLEMKPGLAVRGKVVGPDGSPVADAEIRSNNVGGLQQAAWRWRARYYGSNEALAKSDADGSFRVTNLPPGNAISFFAQKKPMAGEPSESVRLAAGEPEPVLTLKLVPGATIAGRVLDADGAPVAARQVNWQLNDRRRQGWGSTTTGDDGTYRLEGVSAGPVILNSWGGGDGQSAQLTLDPPVKPGDVREGVDLKVARTATIRGIVVDEAGSPVARELILQGRASTSQANSNVDGTFEARVPEGSYTIGARKEGAWEIDGQGVGATAPSDNVRIVVSERPTTIVAGKVVGPDGTMIPLCTLRAGPQPRDRWNMESTDEVAGGEFRREVRQAPPFDVVVSSPRGSHGESLNVRGRRVRVDAATTEMVIALDAGLEVKGRVVDPASAGVEGVMVRVGESAAMTDAAGAFRLGGLAEGDLSLTVRAPKGFAPVPDRRVKAGGEEVVVTLVRGGSIAGRVLGLDQVAGAQGWISAENVGVNSALLADGTFRLDGLPDSGTVDLRVQVWSNTGAAALRPAQLKDVRVGTMDVEIRLDRGVAIRGSVVDAEGKPAASVMIQSEASDGTMAQADADGRWTLAGLAPGPQTLTVMSSNGRSLVTGIKVDAPSDDVRLVLPPPRKLAGRLLGSGLRSFNVQAFLTSATTAAGAEARSVGSAKVDGDGRFALEVSGEGPFSIRAQSSDDERFGRLDGARPGTDANVTLEPGLPIEGVVESADGVATTASGWVWARGDAWSTYAMIGKDGSFRIRGLPPGRYKVNAQSENGTSSPKDEVDAGATGVRLRFGSR